MDVGETKAQIPLKNKGEHGSNGFDGLKRIEQWGIKY